MARGGYQKHRIQQKKQQERLARKRARRRRMILTWVISVVAVALLGAVTLFLLTRDDTGSLAGKPTPSPSPTGPCTKPGPDTKGKKQFANPPCMSIDTKAKYTAILETSMGRIEVELFASAAPQTVNNFVFLARQGYFDNSPFHRVIPNFGEGETAMIQGGDPVNRNGTGGPGYTFGDENTIPLDQPGYLAMANSGAGTNGSQFFILEGTVGHLNVAGQCNPGGQGCHSVFGRVVKGLDVVDRIGSVPRDEGDKPRAEVVVRKVTIRESAG